jgi:hypothetical protein
MVFASTRLRDRRLGALRRKQTSSFDIADDYAAFREFLKSFVAKMPETCIAGEAADGEEAVQLVARLKPDLVLMDLLMDLEMPRMDARTRTGTPVVFSMISKTLPFFAAPDLPGSSAFRLSIPDT